MTVEIIQLQGGAPPGLLDVTQFSDNLQPPDQPFIWGNLYHCCQMQSGILNSNADTLASRCNRSGAGLTFTGGGGGSALLRCNGIPRPLSFKRVDGKNQFAEVQIVSDGSAGVNVNTVGVAVYTQTNQSNCYALRKNPAGTAAGVQLVRSTPGVDTFLGAVHAIAANDVCRIEVRSAAGTNTLKLLINGVVVETQNDNGITPGGLPSLDCAALFTGGQTTVFANFNCGLLTT